MEQKTEKVYRVRLPDGTFVRKTWKKKSHLTQHLTLPKTYRKNYPAGSQIVEFTRIISEEESEIFDLHKYQEEVLARKEKRKLKEREEFLRKSAEKMLYEADKLKER